MLNKITGVTAAAVVGIAATVAGAQSGAVQWKVEDGGNGHWYKLIVSGPISWNQASLECESLHGHLATINDPEEDNVVANVALQSQGWNFQHYYGPWLGGYQKTSAKDYIEPRGGWKWVTGEPWQWAAWEQSGYSEPNNCNCNCGDENFLQYKTFSNIPDRIWNDVNGSGLTNCPQPVSFIIEWDADCNNDGIVDYGQCHNGTLPDYNSNNIPDCCERGETCVVGNYPVQWRIEDGGNGHWYQLDIDQTGVNWADAALIATAKGGKLGQIETATERQYLFSLCASSPTAWNRDGGGALGPWLGGWQQLGAQEPNGGWAWTDGSSVDFDTCRFITSDPSGCGVDENRMSFWCPSAGGVYAGSDAYETSDYPDGGICGGLGPIRAFLIEWSTDCNNDSIVDYGQILTGQLADSNTNGVPDICEQPQCQDADITKNQIIDGADLGAMLAFWGPVNPVLPQADINRDGDVNGADLSLLLSFWGPCP
jgi:hypothetical protein